MRLFAMTRPTKYQTTRTDTYTDVGDSLFTAQVDFHPESARSQPAAAPVLNAQTAGLLRAVRCLGPPPAPLAPDSLVDDLGGTLLKVDLDQFWHGPLPETPAHVAFATATFTSTNGQSAQISGRTLLAPDDPRYLTDELPHAGREGPPPDRTGGVYGTDWWKAPSGRWYLIIGGSSDIARIRVWGQIDKDTHGNTLVIRGPKTQEPPATVVAALDGHRTPAEPTLP